MDIIYQMSRYNGFVFLWSLLLNDDLNFRSLSMLEPLDLHRPSCRLLLVHVVTILPAARVHVGENPQHEVPQRERLEGGGDDDVPTLRQRAPHEHRPSVDVGGRRHVLLGQDVVQPVLPVQLHLEARGGFNIIL